MSVVVILLAVSKDNVELFGGKQVCVVWAEAVEKWCFLLLIYVLC